jgi:hypothetical protein
MKIRADQFTGISRGSAQICQVMESKPTCAALMMVMDEPEDNNRAQANNKYQSAQHQRRPK